jgi:hypothetical protein
MSAMKRPGIIAACLIFAVLILLGVGSISTKAYLRAHATPCWAVPSNDGKFKIVMYRYPRLNDIPESIGFGQGFVQLQKTASGKVVAQKVADDLESLNSFRWSSNEVTIYRRIGSDRFAKWEFPK